MSSKLIWKDLEIGETIGGGQAGEVYRAKLRRSYLEYPKGSDLAVKVYRSWVLEQPGSQERIMRELLVGRSIDCPNIIKPLCLIYGPNNVPALVMPFLQGRTLSDVLTQAINSHKLISVDTSIVILTGLANALRSLHQQNIIHRDVKPGNIMLLDDGTPVLLDLGVIDVPSMANQNTTTKFLGTITYSSPEYLFTGHCSTISDVYSLGIIAIELFTNRYVFSPNEYWSMIIAKKHEIASSSSTRYFTVDAEELNAIMLSSSIGLAEAMEYLIQMMTHYYLYSNPDLYHMGPQFRITSDELFSILQSKFWLSPFYVLWAKDPWDEPKLVLHEFTKESWPFHAPYFITSHHFAKHYFDHNEPVFPSPFIKSNLNTKALNSFREFMARYYFGLPQAEYISPRINKYEWGYFGIPDDVNYSWLESFYSLGYARTGDIHRKTTKINLNVSIDLLLLFRYGYIT